MPIDVASLYRSHVLGGGPPQLLVCTVCSVFVAQNHPPPPLPTSPHVDPLSSPPTEASKLVMQYVAAVSGKGEEVDRVKTQLLQSNPVLEGTKVLSPFKISCTLFVMTLVNKQSFLLGVNITF